MEPDFSAHERRQAEFDRQQNQLAGVMGGVLVAGAVTAFATVWIRTGEAGGALLICTPLCLLWLVGALGISNWHTRKWAQEENERLREEGHLFRIEPR